jgi:Skp family chaperone for outer membrane proteins
VAAANLANLISVVCQAEAAVICGRLQRVVAEGFKNVDKDMNKIERDMERLDERLDERLAMLERKVKKLEQPQKFERGSDGVERSVPILDDSPKGYGAPIDTPPYKVEKTIKATPKVRKKAARKRSGKK